MIIMIHKSYLSKQGKKPTSEKPKHLYKNK